LPLDAQGTIDLLTISFATFQHDLVAATIERAAGWMYLPRNQTAIIGS
jgi:hypothetical protein